MSRPRPIDVYKRQEMDEVDCVLGTGNREAVLFAVEQGRKGEKLNLVEEPSHFFEEMGVAATHRTRGYLKIQDGCDRYCSYCICLLYTSRCV